jgi:DNA-binding response OmpR family regulator
MDNKNNNGLILIIEDEIDLLKITEFRLSKSGYRTISATDGKKGLELASQYRPNLILLDLNIPKIDGFEVCKRLKSNADLKKIPIIIITASYLNVVEKKSSLKAECILLKPYELKDLLSNVKKYISS